MGKITGNQLIWLILPYVNQPIIWMSWHSAIELVLLATYGANFDSQIYPNISRFALIFD